eukprot:15110218-Alexandrium_andersonii.AAC.1
MSASLVGSEMCIRDSLAPLPRPAASAASSSSRPTGAGGDAAAPAQRKAVSYTHLTLPTICSV